MTIEKATDIIKGFYSTYPKRETKEGTIILVGKVFLFLREHLQHERFKVTGVYEIMIKSSIDDRIRRFGFSNEMFEDDKYLKEFIDHEISKMIGI